LIEFDEGLVEQISFMQSDIDLETFENTYNQTYSVELSDGTTYDLMPNGAYEKVLFEDRGRFIEMALKARMGEADAQIAAVKKGLCRLVPLSLIKLLTYKELERLVCGKKTVDINLLKSNTKYALELNENVNRVKWLWEILFEIADEDKVKFIKFCYAQERLPPTMEDYEKLNVHFTIKPYIDKNKKDAFPKADTCFFALEIPEYSSKDVMKTKILTAINLDNVSINADKVNPENKIDNHYIESDNYDEQFDEEE
jgi:hypothetical protein